MISTYVALSENAPKRKRERKGKATSIINESLGGQKSWRWIGRKGSAGRAWASAHCLISIAATGGTVKLPLASRQHNNSCSSHPSCAVVFDSVREIFETGGERDEKEMKCLKRRRKGRRVLTKTDSR